MERRSDFSDDPPVNARSDGPSCGSGTESNRSSASFRDVMGAITDAVTATLPDLTSEAFPPLATLPGLRRWCHRCGTSTDIGVWLSPETEARSSHRRRLLASPLASVDAAAFSTAGDFFTARCQRRGHRFRAQRMRVIHRWIVRNKNCANGESFDRRRFSDRELRGDLGARRGSSSKKKRFRNCQPRRVRWLIQSN